MTELVAGAAEAYALAHTSPAEGLLEQVAHFTERETRSPAMMSGLAEARLLELLIVASGARRVLEIGTFTGFGTLTMAAAVGPSGRVVTLEVDSDMAAVARRHFDASEYADRIELIVGPALDTLPRVQGPLDLVYIDAMKSQYPEYYEAVVDKLGQRGVIVADNLFRAGAVLDEGPGDEGTQAMRAFAQRVQDDPRMHNVLLTVGDGLMVAWRSPEAE